MTAPDRPKRPSARPPRRPTTLPPPPDLHVEVVDSARKSAPESTEENTVAPKAQRPSVRPAAKGQATPEDADRADGAGRARVSARRASSPSSFPTPVVDGQAAPALPEAGEPRRASASGGQAGAKTPQRKSAAPKSKARVEVRGEAGEPSSDTSAEVSLLKAAQVALAEPGLSDSVAVSLADDEDDIWRDSAPMPGIAQASQAALNDSTELARELRTAFKPASRLARGASEGEQAGEPGLIGSTQSLLSTDYYFRQYGAHGIRSLSAEVDEFGLDPHAEERARPALELLCKRYFRVEVEGSHYLPQTGRALMVANRAGTLPWDGLMLRTALRLERPELPPVRWLSEDSVFHYPFLGVFMNRLGAVRACQENAERLLSQDKLVVAFPEGAQGSRKLFKNRYELQRFGRGGYVKLALKLGAPILPTAIIGAEETNPLLARSRLLGRLLGTDAFPFTPTFPWLGPVGLLPAPVKWRILVGEPIDLSGYGPDAAEDALLVHRLNEQIRGILQSLIKQGTASRRSALFG